LKATQAKVLDFIKKSPQFIIPIYQRNYSWTQDQCRQLWNDIVRTGENDAVSAHFIGSIVYIEKGIYHVTSQPPLLVIDGQQRLTTITILLSALMESIGDSEPIDGFSAEKIKNYYLVNPYEKDDKHYKLLLSQTDKDTLLHLLGAVPPQEESLRVKENFDFFKEQLRKLNDLTIVCKGLAKLVIVDVSLNREQDNPQLIFESMNSTGLELTQADLIRNFLLMGLEPALQTDFYSRYWRPMEVGFGQAAYTTHFDSFMRHYLTVKTGDIPRVDQVYTEFKKYVQQPKIASLGIEALIADIRSFAGYYCNIVLGVEPVVELRYAFTDLKDLKVDVAYPFLLELYDDYVNGNLQQEELFEVVRLLESYVFRRAACDIPTNSLNKTFTTLSKNIRKDKYIECIKTQFLLLQSYRRFPSDEEFKRELQIRNLYTPRLRGYWPRRMENFGRKERVPVEEYTVEHILPQNEDLSMEWRTALGENWKEIQGKWLHTLGNLTLTGYNSEYSDRPFSQKRDMEGGFRESPLRLNKGLGQLDKWDEEAIQSRAKRLAEEASHIWPMPELSSEVLDQYRPRSATTGYSVNDHPYLLTGITNELFDAFRREVLAFDPCVTEEFLKLYVAYKAETNFVDIVPQAKRLRLALNMPFTELDDPRGICRDITNVGRWGNGDVELFLESLNDLPYVINIVRQSFDRQIESPQS
jgi:uncharacterized protein with ParB-like and HNH nuclease domain/predicted transport protein